MAKRTIEIEDILQERVDGAIEEVKQLLLDYLKENEPSSTPCISNDLDYSGSVHEIVDSSVPIYIQEIDDTWYLYKDDLVEAYENAGVGSNPLENNGMAAIYFYIQEKVNDWYHGNADDIFSDWQDSHEKQESLKDEINNMTTELDDRLFDMLDTEPYRVCSNALKTNQALKDLIARLAAETSLHHRDDTKETIRLNWELVINELCNQDTISLALAKKLISEFKDSDDD